jgi:hypothetical protein
LLIGLNSFNRGNLMKKLRQRKVMVVLVAIGVALLCFGSHFAWRGITHHGDGVWTFGGYESESHGDMGSDEHAEVISEHQFKRECYVTAVMFFVMGVGILSGVISKWREKNELEKSWKRMISNPDNIKDIHKHPENYRDDFKKWIKENRPDLAFWDLPPNSSN